MICPVCRGDMLREGDNLVCVVCGKEIRTHYDVPQWIPVKDRLPSNSNRVLVYGVYRRFEAKIVDILRYQGKDYGWEEQSAFTVTHWMPLPEPPQEEHE